MAKGYNKYGAKKTVVNGITFDSQREADRYCELMLMLRAGEIRELKLQPEFTLQEGFRTPSGEKVRAVKYIADFSYKMTIDGEERTCVEDVKGVRTKDYALKKKLMEGKGIKVIEV